MDVYKIPIEYAFIVFPFIAFVLTIPFLIHQYRKFGSIPILKSFCFYSMILYTLCAYFLVMLPLPSIEKVAKMTGPTMQLVPFQFIKDIIATTSFDISNLQDFINIFRNSTVYTVLFNIVLTLPFGVYLRYLFKKKWYHSLIYTFLLSLFFELTQLSGLYGIYPRPYRLFDIDDLLINTLGGLLGHALTPIFTFFIPTIDELDEKSYRKGSKVKLLRRGVALTIDILFILIFCVVTRIILYNTAIEKYYALIVLFLYYIVFPSFTEGRTLGKKMIRLKISANDTPAKWYQILIRNIILAFLILYPFSWMNMLELVMKKAMYTRLWYVLIAFQLINIGCYIYTSLTKKEHVFLYEIITGTKNVSTIAINVPEKKSVESSIDTEKKEIITELDCKNE